MDLANYRLVITDLDGTLVEYGTDYLTPAIKDAVAQLRQAGAQFTIATGRSWKKTRQIARELGVTVPVIVQAGAIVMDPVTETVLQMTPLRPELAIQLQELSGAGMVDHFCLDESGAYFSAAVQTPGGKWLSQSSGEQCSLATLGNLKCTMVKHMFIGAEKEVKTLSERILQTIKPQPHLILWPPDREAYDWFLEAFDPKASKGQALQWLANRMQLPMKQIIAFGDGHNDLDMLNFAGLGVAMAEAPEPVRSLSDLVIPGPLFNGMAQFLTGQINGKQPLQHGNGTAISGS